MNASLTWLGGFTTSPESTYLAETPLDEEPARQLVLKQDIVPIVVHSVTSAGDYSAMLIARNEKFGAFFAYTVELDPEPPHDAAPLRGEPTGTEPGHAPRARRRGQRLRVGLGHRAHRGREANYGIPAQTSVFQLMEEIRGRLSDPLQRPEHPAR